MNTIKVLNGEDTLKLCNFEEIFNAVEIAYKRKAEGLGKDFPLIFHEFESGEADVDIKSGALINPPCYGLKVVSYHSDNPCQQLPALTSTSMIFDATNGQLQGLINFDQLIGIRTAVAACIGAVHLGNENSDILLLVGCGHLSSYILEGMMIKFKGLKQILIYDPINKENAHKLQKKINSDLITIVDNIEQASKQADIIITATPSTDYIIKSEWVKEGTHLSCIGADMSTKNEVDPELLTRAKLYYDDRMQSLSVGEFETAYNKKIITDDTLMYDIGVVLLDKSKGRTNESDITVFDCTGISIQDIMIGKILLDKAKDLNIGQSINF